MIKTLFYMAPECTYVYTYDTHFQKKKMYLKTYERIIVSKI